MAATAASVADAPAAVAAADPELNEMDFSDTPAADYLVSGLHALLFGLDKSPEASSSGKRTKMIHKKGEVKAETLPLTLKYNADFKAGHLVNLRVVTVKPGGGDESATDGEGAGAGAGAGAGVSGVKRPRRKLDLKKMLQQAIAACEEEGKSAEAATLKELLAKF